MNAKAQTSARNQRPTISRRTVFAKTTEAKAAHVSRQHFADALDRLTDADHIAVETYGPPSKPGKRLVRRGLL